MTSRERIIAAINHKESDTVPIDIGATSQTGMNASTLYKLRKALGMEEKAITISEIFQMLGVIDKDLRDYVGSDVIGLNNPVNMFGVRKTKMKSFIMPDGTPTLVSEKNEFDILEDGTIQAYPQGNRNVPPSAHMPAGGSFFDNIDRAPDYDEDNLTPKEDFKDSFGIITDENALYIQQESKRLFEETDYGIVGNLGGAGLGDSAMIPGAHELYPRGIRKFDDWLMAHMLYPDYIREVFEMQTETMLKNLEIYKQAVGNNIQIIWISGTDFGTQNGPFLSIEAFRDLYLPYYKRINDWVHQNTPWKTFYHCCGSVVTLLDSFIEMGVDILNPVQVSASGMDAINLKEKYGQKIVFWGGGVDTQQTLPFGTPDEVKMQVKERLEIFSKSGGYVFNPIHNVVADTPIENLIAMYETVHEFNKEKLRMNN